MADKFAARSGEVKPLNEVDYEDIVNAAAIKMRKATSGVRGQIITVQDSLDWWVMKETERRILAALSSTQARADKLEAELASAQQSNENWMNRCLAAESRAAAMREALEASTKALDYWMRTYAPEFCRDEHVAEARKAIAEAGGTLAFIAERVATNREALSQTKEGVWKRKAEAAEASLAQANEALKAVNKLIEWERENGTHFVLIDREVEYVSGLWFDAKNAVITALKARRS